MTRATIAGVAFATALLLALALAGGYLFLRWYLGPAAAISPAVEPTAAPAAATESDAAPESYQGFLYGRITTVGGATHEGRLRWGGDEEAFWGDWFNGSKRQNHWLAHVPPGRLPEERPQRTFLGFKIGDRGEVVGRLFMVRFGEIARVEAQGREVRVTLKSGTAFDLDRLEASDFDDDVRVWDGGQVVDLESLQIRSIELLPTPPLGDAPSRLHGTVRTRRGDFTGFVQWDRDDGLGSDELEGRTADGEVGLRYDTIRSIARRSGESALVTLANGREIVLSGGPEVGSDNRGIAVDDERFGRVLVSWDVFERVDFSPGGSGPAYDDFPPGRPLTGSVTTRAGRRLAGRLVYDVDEGETTETLDASAQGVDYTIPFGLIASIALGGGEGPAAGNVRVTLYGGEELELERAGDLRDGNAGLLVFVDGQERAEYVPWAEVERIDFAPPPAGPA